MRVFRNAVVGFVAAVALSVVSFGAQAATLRTINFEATNLIDNVNDPFGALGLSGPVDTVTGSLTFDPMAAPFSDNTNSSLRVTRTPYVSFSANVGGVILNGAPSSVSDDYIQVRDGTRSPRLDSLQVASFTNQDLSATGQGISPGVILDLINLQLIAQNNTAIVGGTAVPAVDVLNSAFAREIFQFSLLTDGNSVQRFATYNTVTFTEVSAVPLPAALPLFLTVLAGMAGLRLWRRRATA